MEETLREATTQEMNALRTAKDAEMEKLSAAVQEKEKALSEMAAETEKQKAEIERLQALNEELKNNAKVAEKTSETAKEIVDDDAKEKTADDTAKDSKPKKEKEKAKGKGKSKVKGKGKGKGKVKESALKEWMESKEVYEKTLYTELLSMNIEALKDVKALSQSDLTV